GQYVSFEAVDAEIIKALQESLQNNKKTALILSGIYGPSLAGVIREFKGTFKNLDVIVYNPFGNSAQRQANLETFGSEDLHQYNLEKARIIVGINADFLQIGTSPVYLTKQYSRRK